MGESDERFGAFGDGLSLEIDHAIFGDDIHDVGARGGHDVALREVEHDPAAALAALVIGGGEANKRLAALRGIGAAHELQLPTSTADVAMAVRFGGGLSLQIYLRCVVDRYDVVVLHDDVRRISVIDGAAL